MKNDKTKNPDEKLKTQNRKLVGEIKGRQPTWERGVWPPYQMASIWRLRRQIGLGEGAGALPGPDAPPHFRLPRQSPVPQRLPLPGHHHPQKPKGAHNRSSYSQHVSRRARRRHQLPAWSRARARRRRQRRPWRRRRGPW